MPAEGVAGVDWNALIHSQRIDAPGDDATIAAIQDAVTAGSDILNNSWHMTDSGGDARYSDSVRAAFMNAYKLNRVACVAMGNEEDTDPGVTQYPAGFGQGIIAVGSTDRRGAIAFSSSTGPHIDVAAPGVGIWSTIPYAAGSPPAYGSNSGTSMATPHVAGLAGLLLARNPALYNDDIEQLIRLSATDKGAPGFDNTFGMGRIDAYKALLFLEAPYALLQEAATGGTIHSSTSSYYTQGFLAGAGPTDGTYLAKRHEVRKAVTFSSAYAEVPEVWGRGVDTRGYSTDNPNWGMGWCEPVPGTITASGCTLRTYIYEVRNINGTPLGWYPTTAGNTAFAWTSLGRTAISQVGNTPDPVTAMSVHPHVNPVTGPCVFKVSIPSSTVGSLEVFDVQGRRVRTIKSGAFEALEQEISWDGRSQAGTLVPPGTYLYRLRTGLGETSGKLTVAR